MYIELNAIVSSYLILLSKNKREENYQFYWIISRS